MPPSTVYKGDLTEVTFGHESGMDLTHNYAGTFLFIAKQDASWPNIDTSIITFSGGAASTPVNNGILAYPTGMLVGSRLVFSGITSNFDTADNHSNGGPSYTIVKHVVVSGATELTISPALKTDHSNAVNSANGTLHILPFKTPSIDTSMVYAVGANASGERVLTDQFVGLVGTIALPETTVDLKRYHIVGLGRDVAVQVPGRFLNQGGSFETNLHNARWFYYALGHEVTKVNAPDDGANSYTFYVNGPIGAGDSSFAYNSDGADAPAINSIDIGVGDYIVMGGDAYTATTDINVHRETTSDGTWPTQGSQSIISKAIKQETRRIVAITESAGAGTIWVDDPFNFSHANDTVVEFARFATAGTDGSPHMSTASADYGLISNPTKRLLFSRTTVPSFAMEVSIRRNDSDGGDITTEVTTTVIDNGGGYAAGTTSAMTTDGLAASTSFSVNDNMYTSTGVFVGMVTVVASTSVTISAGTEVALADNAVLYKAVGGEITDGGASDSKQLTRVFRGCKVKDWSLTADTDAAVRMTVNFDAALCYTDTGRLESASKGDRYDAHRLFEDTANTEVKRKESGIAKRTQKPFMFYNGTMQVGGVTLGQVVSFTLNGSTGVEQYYTITGANVPDSATDQVPFAGTRNPAIAVEGKTEYDLEMEIIVDDPLFYHKMRRAVDHFDDDTSDTTDADMIRLSFTKQGAGATRETMDIVMDDYFIVEAPLPIPEDKGPIRSTLKILPKSVRVVAVDTLLHS